MPVMGEQMAPLYIEAIREHGSQSNFLLLLGSSRSVSSSLAGLDHGLEIISLRQTTRWSVSTAAPRLLACHVVMAGVYC